MAAKRHKPEEIVSKLRQVDVLLGQGKSRIYAIRQIGVTAFTYYRWRKNWTHPGKVEAPYTVCIASASNLTGLVKSSVECRRTGL